MNMGIVKKPSLCLYWSTDEIFKTPFFSAVMSRDRYFQIMRYLHFVDNQELSILNAQILMAKSFRNAPKMLQFRKAVVEQLVNGRTFHLTEQNAEPVAPIPHFRFNRDNFHCPISNNSRLACKVHIQWIDTQYSCAICGVHMCPDPCFL